MRCSHDPLGGGWRVYSVCAGTGRNPAQTEAARLIVVFVLLFEVRIVMPKAAPGCPGTPFRDAGTSFYEKSADLSDERQTVAP